MFEGLLTRDGTISLVRTWVQQHCVAHVDVVVQVLENGVCVDNYSMSVLRNRGEVVSCGGFQMVFVSLPSRTLYLRYLLGSSLWSSGDYQECKSW